MKELTFGFMDPKRDPRANSDLYVQLRTLGIDSFKDQNTCNLESFSHDSIDTSHGILVDGDGRVAGTLRDAFYAQLQRNNAPICFPDVQSYFLYAFTMGINRFSVFLMEPSDSPTAHPIPPHAILGRHFPIRGPEWLCNAANREMLPVENVFCDFQNKLMVPIARTPLGDGRMIADMVGGAFLWAYLAGTYWLKEAVAEISSAEAVTGRAPQPMVIHQVKHSMECLTSEELLRVITASAIFEDTTKLPVG